MKILVTGGGTEEPIDSVRSVCNFSTGRTASFFAEFFFREGNDVTALMSVRAEKPSEECRLISGRDFSRRQDSAAAAKNGAAAVFTPSAQAVPERRCRSAGASENADGRHDCAAPSAAPENAQRARISRKTCSGRSSDFAAGNSAPAAAKGSLRVKTYRTFSDLEKLLRGECAAERYDCILHAAAVSDFSPETIRIDGAEYAAGEIAKIPSGAELAVRFRKNPKLVMSLKEWAGRACAVIAFKLTSGASEEERRAAVQKLFDAAGPQDAPDAVISNDLSEISADSHPCVVYTRDGRARKCAALSEAALALEAIL